VIGPAAVHRNVPRTARFRCGYPSSFCARLTIGAAPRLISHRALKRSGGLWNSLLRSRKNQTDPTAQWLENYCLYGFESSHLKILTTEKLGTPRDSKDLIKKARLAQTRRGHIFSHHHRARLSEEKGKERNLPAGDLKMPSKCRRRCSIAPTRSSNSNRRGFLSFLGTTAVAWPVTTAFFSITMFHQHQPVMHGGLPS
jgi:hypothetical protein